MVGRILQTLILLIVGVVLLSTQADSVKLLKNQRLVISGVSNVVYSGLQVRNSGGDCVQIINSTNVTIQASNIGPCGVDGSVSGRGIYVSGGGGINAWDAHHVLSHYMPAVPATKRPGAMSGPSRLSNARD